MFQIVVDFWKNLRVGCNKGMSWDCKQQVLIKNISKSYNSIALIVSQGALKKLETSKREKVRTHKFVTIQNLFQNWNNIEFSMA